MFKLPAEIRGLVFDCDGTVADTMPLHYRAWCQALGECGYEFPEPLFYSLAGVPSLRISRLLKHDHGWERICPETLTVRKEWLFEQMIPQTKPIEPVVNIIHQYAGKLPMAVATGGDRNLCTKTLTAVKLLPYFKALVTADDVTHGKPAPDIFLEAARRIDIKPQQCCAFEDGDPGIQAARAAGMMVVDVREML